MYEQLYGAIVEAYIFGELMDIIEKKIFGVSENIKKEWTKYPQLEILHEEMILDIFNRVIGHKLYPIICLQNRLIIFSIKRVYIIYK